MPSLLQAVATSQWVDKQQKQQPNAVSAHLMAGTGGDSGGDGGSVTSPNSISCSSRTGTESGTHSLTHSLTHSHTPNDALWLGANRFYIDGRSP